MESIVGDFSSIAPAAAFGCRTCRRELAGGCYDPCGRFPETTPRPANLPGGRAGILHAGRFHTPCPRAYSEGGGTLSSQEASVSRSWILMGAGSIRSLSARCATLREIETVLFSETCWYHISYYSNAHPCVIVCPSLRKRTPSNHETDIDPQSPAAIEIRSRAD